MKARWMTRLLIAASLLAVLAVPEAARAAQIILIVDQNFTQTDSTHFKTIQDAIAAAHTNLSGGSTVNTYQIQVTEGTYIGAITLQDDGVPLFGASTAGTFLIGTGSGPTINTNGHSHLNIRNFTFKAPSAAGISITGGSDVNITNNVFWLPNAFGVQNQGATSSFVVNNTFYQNGTAISTTAADLKIDNDIFAQNATAISTQVSLSSLSYCDFYLNTANGVTNLGEGSIPNTTGNTNPNPLFVNANAGDFHLQSTSPIKGKGDPGITGVPDMGAYGGPSADAGSSNPPTVTVTSTIISPKTPPTSMILNWSQASSPVTAYRVFYTTSPNQVTAVQGDGTTGIVVSPVTNTSATLTFNTLPNTPGVPSGAPVLTTTAMDRALQLNWTPVSGATGYVIYYSTQSFTAASLPAAAITVDGGATTSYVLGGLTNADANGNPHYFVAVQPIAQAQISAQVTAVIDPTVISTPPNANESAKSLPTVQKVGPAVVGTLSNVKEDFAEAVTPFPNVKGGGCFIATAAYGFYSAPQVQSLRMFRDRYLMTNATGRAFVSWYYKHGPSGARFLNAHPWLKAPVRVVLFPLVVFSAFLVYTSLLIKVALMMTAATTSYFLYRRLENRSMARARRLS